MTQNDKPGLFVVDGSNIATEGRSKPSLEQLNDAVEAFRGEYPDVDVTVVVDATFGHRIAKKEVKAFDKAVAANELVTPPAGAVGRGDAFILAIADKANAGVFSNDSFQEFHGEYAWLFDTGRLIGGKPVPNVGWVFVDRNPVRGRKSRESIKAAKADQAGTPTDAKEQAQRRVRKKKAAANESPATSEPAANEPAPNATASSEPASNATASSEPASNATASGESADPGSTGRTGKASKRRRSSSSEKREQTSGSAATTGAPRSNQVNDPGAFFDFVEHHQVGSWIRGVVDSYASHGAYARVGDVLIYIPLRLMADPAPTSARKMLTTGDEVDLVIVAYVPDRLSIDAALPAMAPSPTADSGAPAPVPGDGDVAEAPAPVPGDGDVAGAPAPVPGDGDVAEAPAPVPGDGDVAEAPAPVPGDGDVAEAAPPAKRASRRRPRKRAAADTAKVEETPVKRSAAKKKAAVKKAPAKKKAAVKKAPAKKKAAARKAPAKKKAAARKAPAKKKAAVRKAPAKKKAAARKAPAKKKAAEGGSS